eukprot:TRINITY_DN622_c1_g1_i1.p1 TRINITY_DN622_c1_g1~~TRINITY_DN622_c1_g1_i1.p1  ORF type:complete len:615 (+),score=33.74 TRINITY_DN622_c1_g1_i1:106-1950(+)
MNILALSLVCSVLCERYAPPAERQINGGIFSGGWKAKEGANLTVLDRLLPSSSFGYVNGSSEMATIADKSGPMNVHPGHVQIHLTPSRNNSMQFRGILYFVTGSKIREYSLRGVLSNVTNRMAVMLVPAPMQSIVSNKYISESRIANSFIDASYSVDLFGRNQTMWVAVHNKSIPGEARSFYQMPNETAVRLIPPKGRKGSNIWSQTHSAIEADGCIWFGDLTTSNITKKVPNHHSKTEVFHSITGDLTSLTCNATFQVQASQEEVVLETNNASSYLLIGLFVSMLQTWGMSQQTQYARTRSSQSRISWITFLNIGTFEWSLASYHWSILEFMPLLVKIVMAISLFHLVSFHFCARHAYDSLESQGVHSRLWLLPTLSFPINLLWRLSEYRLVIGPVPLWIPCLFVVHSVWVPQIIHSAEHKAARPVTFSLLMTTLWSRCFFCYYRLVDSSVFTPFKSEVGVYIAVTVWVMFQTAVVVAQQILGPTFFIPQGMVSPAYNYHAPLPPQYRAVQPEDIPRGTAHKRGSSTSAPVDLESGLGTHIGTSVAPASLDCVICQTNIDPTQSSGYMLAPCEHIFHAQCLQQWMQQKMECPVCRRSLPECQMEQTNWSVFSH